MSRHRWLAGFCSCQPPSAFFSQTQACPPVPPAPVSGVATTGVSLAVPLFAVASSSVPGVQAVVAPGPGLAGGSGAGVDLYPISGFRAGAAVTVKVARVLPTATCPLEGLRDQQWWC